MKANIVIVAFVLLAGCAPLNNKNVSLATQNVTSPENYLGYQPIDPIPVEKVLVYDDLKNEMKENYWASITDKSQIRELLPLQSAQVSVSKNDISGKVSYLAASLSGERGNYTVIMDYMKYRIEDVLDDNSQYIGNGRIGIGLRIKAVVETNKVDLNLGSLLSIGLEAKRGNLKGGISVDVVGIDSADVTNLIPLTSEIDQTSIQAALQALASIKTKIFEDKTILTPHLVAINQAKPGVSEKIREITTISKRKGISEAQSRIAKKIEILSSITPNNTFDKTKWNSLVDKSDLSDSSKTNLKALNDFNSVNTRLDLDAAMNGKIISALHMKL